MDEISQYINISENSHLNDQQIADLFGITREAVRSRRRRLGLIKDKSSGNELTPEARWRAVANDIVKALQEKNIPPEAIGSIKKIKLSQYQNFIKSVDGEPEVVDLQSIRFEIDPKWKKSPDWAIIQPVVKQKLKLRKIKINKRKNKLAVVLPDPQIGFWKDIQTGELDGFFDERAINLALKLIEELQPDLIINLGDFLDLPEHGKYLQEAGFAQTTQEALNYAYQFLKRQRELAPRAKIVLLEGNHEKRLPNYILTNAKAAFGLHQAHDPEKLPVMSVPHLLALNSLGVDYIAGYPSNELV